MDKTVGNLSASVQCAGIRKIWIVQSYLKLAVTMKKTTDCIHLVLFPVLIPFSDVYEVSASSM